MRAIVLAAIVSTSFAFAPPLRHTTRHARSATSVQAVPPWVAAVPSQLAQLPGLLPAPPPIVGDLATYFAKTVITWGVPAVAIVVVVSSIFDGDDDGDRRQAGGGDFGAEFALDDAQDGPRNPFKKGRKAPNRPPAPTYLKVERLNERLESFSYSLDAATRGRYAAKKARRQKRLAAAFGDELGLADLSDAALEAVGKAEAEYLAARAEHDAAGFRARAALRLATGATNATNATMGGKLKGMMGKGANDGALGDLEKATRGAQEAELAYLSAVAAVLPDDVARRRFATLAAQGGAVDPSAPLSFLRTNATEKTAFVLDFNGDVQASQTANLREEVTAVLGAAAPGDEVVLRLSTGGGTVTGYGLAAAQLLRLKEKGLHLTVCVEQVAASGGYMMACCGDRVVASPFAILGSIGVITDIPNVYERLQKEGIEFQTVTAGEFKRTVTPTKKVTKEDLAKTKKDITEIFDLFKGFVGAQRPTLDIDAVATGETWFGQDALDRNLCDELKTFDDVKLELFERGVEVLSVAYAPPPATPLDALLQPAGSALPSGLAALARDGRLADLAKAALPVLKDVAAASETPRRAMALDADVVDRYRAEDRW